MTSLLIPESPLQVLPTLARLIGLTEAIVLQQVHYLSLRGGGSAWVQKSFEDWQAEFKFIFSRRALERAFAELRKRGLLVSEPVPGGGRRTRVRIDHDAVDALLDSPEGGIDGPSPIRQSGGTNPPIWRDQSANLAGPIRQSGGTPLNKGGEERMGEEALPNGNASLSDASRPRRTRASSTATRTVTLADLSVVFDAWRAAVGATERTAFDDRRRRLVRRAIKGRIAAGATKEEAIAECVDAVRGWRHSPHHRGENKQRQPYNALELLLRDSEHLEFFRDLERRHGIPGDDHGAGRCPGAAPPPELAALWTPIAAELERRVAPSTHAIWLRPLHPHGVIDGTLVLGTPPEIAGWVGDRFMRILETAAGRPVRVVACDEHTAPTADERRTAAAGGRNGTAAGAAARTTVAAGRRANQGDTR